MRVLALGLLLAACGQAPRDTPVQPYERPVTVAAPQPPIPSASAAPE